MNPVRLAYLVSHPIQYQAPLLRMIAADPGIDLSVFFLSDLSLNAHADPGFGRVVEWDVPLLDGYDHDFLPGFDDGRTLNFWRPLNHGLARRLRAGRFDALWVHGYARLTNLIGMITAKRLGLRVLLRDEATLISLARGPVKRMGKTVFFAGLRQICDATLAIGALNRAYYAHHGFAPDRIFSMPYAVDNDFFQRRAAEAAGRREEFRAELGLDPGRPVILFASKLQMRKRADDLLAAYAALVKGGLTPAPYLVIVGDGERGLALQDKALQDGLDGVRFMGFRNQRELPAFYDLCDVFVLPSFHEPWGLVVNEVMNAGRAVIASDQVGSAPDLVRDGENGYVFPAGDVAALADALAKTLADPAQCRRMGARSLDIISHWGFAEDLAGLKQALAAVLRRPAG